MKNNLRTPNYWQIRKLGEVCEVIGGGTPSRENKSFFGGNIIWLTPTEIEKVNIKTVYDSREKITKLGLLKSSAKVIPANSVLLTSRATIGNVAIAGKNVTTNQGFSSFICSEELYNLFLAYWLKSIIKTLKEKAKGTTFKEISKSEIRNLDFPLPPLAEQHLIVAKIESLFSELDKGIESLKTAQQQLKVYRQAVLKWAFEGKLTNENVNGELPVGWMLVKLGEVCHKIQDGSHFSPHVQYDESGKDRFMYITAKNIRNDHMDLRKLTYIDREFHDSIFPRCNPEYGDVLLTKDGVNTGEVTLNTLHEPFSLLSSVCLFKPNKEKLRSEFLKYFIQSSIGSKVITNSMTGTAIKRIILRKIKDNEIILPPLKEQEKLISEIESRLSVCDKLEVTITENLQQAEVLRQSILKQAFEGRLI